MLDQSCASSPVLSGLILAAWLGSVFAGLGYWALRALRVPMDSFNRWEKGFFCVAFGAGLSQFVPYALGAAGVLSRRSCLIALSALLLLVARYVARIASAAWQELRSLRPRALSLPSKLWASAFALLMGALLLHALALQPFADDDGYHLSAPRRWLEQGSLTYLVTYTATNASMGFEMLYALALSTPGWQAVKLVHYGAGLLTLLGIGLIAKRLGTPAAIKLVLGGLLITTPVLDVPFLFGRAYVDFGALCMTVASILAWLVWRESRESRLLLCMSLCVGFAASFKSTSLSLGVAWAPVLVWQARRDGVPWSKLVCRAALLGALSLLPVLPWLFRSWRLTGNPLFPMFSDLIPTRDFGRELAFVFGRFIHYYSWAVGSGERLGESARRHIVQATLLIVAATCAVLFKLIKEQARRALLVFSAIFVLISVAVAGMVFRYWLPGVLGLLIVVCLHLHEWLARRGLAQWVACITMVTALLVHLTRQDFREDARHDFFVATGLETFNEAYSKKAFWRTWSYLNQRTPPDSKVLMVAFYTTFSASSYGGYWVQRSCFTTDSHMQQTLRLDEWEAFLSSVTHAGITHVVVNARETDAGRHGFRFRAAQNEFAFGRRLATEHGDRVAAFDGLEVYRLRPAPRASTQSDVSHL